MQRTMSVQVKKCQLRSEPSFLGQIIARLNYGDKVEITGEKNSWVQVSPAKTSGGWVHISALTEKELVVNPNSKDVKAAPSSDEIALAGKGFNEQVELEFKQNNRNIDFTWVDNMEKIVISQDEIQSFLQTGELSGNEGGAS